MQKFERNYKIYFEVGERKLTGEHIPQDLIEVAYPFTLNFTTNAGINLSNNGSCKAQLINLPSNVQKSLWKDNWQSDKYILMQLHAGYQDTMPLIFYGFVNQCYSYRQGGSTEYITEIQADDNALIAMYGFSNITFSAGTEALNILSGLLETANGYEVGYITPDIKPLKRDRTFIGQTLDLLGKEYGGYDVFFDKGQLNIISDNDVIPSDGILVITSESGLLGSPRRADQFLKTTMIFEPRIRIGQMIELLSDSIPWFNGVYKVNAVTHHGTISPVTCGKLVTEITLSLGNTQYHLLQKNNNEYNGDTTGQWAKPIKEGFKRISSPFGERKAPKTGASTNHKGIDIAAPLKTPVYAAANGKVLSASIRGGYGRTVELDNGTIEDKKVSSLYAHLKSWVVAPSQQIYQGDLIGYVGGDKNDEYSGVSTGPHLHFEIREGGKPVNPIKYIGNYG